MAEFKAGFARIDITPPLGSRLVGYFHKRHADGILDPLLATAVAVSDGDTTAVMISVDVIGMDQETCDEVSVAIEEKYGISRECVFIACTHTHLGPASARSYSEDGFEEIIAVLSKKLIGVAGMAIDDLKPAEMFVNSAETPVDISFIRRYKMKDGSTKTNPGFLNPEIDHPLGEPDKRVALVLFKRENAPEIAVINFQVHPDVIGGEKMSADYPGFVRRTYEAAVPNSLCMYINGAQGDTNHINVKTPENMLRGGYEFSCHMGRTIAGVAMAIRAMAEKCEATPVLGFQKNIEVPFNKGTAEELEKAIVVKKLHDEGRDDEIWPEENMYRTTLIAEAGRIVRLADGPDMKELHVTGLSIGDFAIVGFPGEPFTEIGRSVKNASKFKMTFAACCANGYEGYYPVESAYAEGGYEAKTAKYKAGTAENLIAAGTDVLDTLYSKK